ncbi:hypothetical protein EPN87_00820 [archaeon]|nr:MAG: hypothetical protein EPN87_00820 [archaeon]
MVLPFLQGLVISFSYLGLFLAGLISSSTIILPLPLYGLVFFAVGLGLNPWLASLAAGAGSALGELTGYFLGRGGHAVIQKKYRRSKFMAGSMKFFRRFGFVTIIATAFLPFPFDFIGILSGISRYDMKKFLLATFIGKTAKILLIAYAGYVASPYVSVLMHEVGL